MSRLFPLLLIGSLLLPAAARAAEAPASDELASDPVIQLYLKFKSSTARLPGLRADGVVLKQDWLLDKLKTELDRDGITVESLALTPEKGNIKVRTTQGVDAVHTIDFRFLPVDWPNRTVRIAFDRSSAAAGDGLIARTLGTLAVGVFGMATGDPLDKLAARQPWASVNGNVLTVKLDEVPSLKSTLDSSLMGYKLFDHIGIRQLSTEQGAIRIRLGLMK
ncbi:hypothetical protein LH462_02125 [Laribacter hongkongensis]|uniref:DUF2993 domain-containing protein n=1 Tax=Laribacter hongkongensis TaxID=168471 RepID=A0ABD4SRJ1_9NEIS|nr:hypothetical protein [Laribacter hongkongensis]MCG9025913.1 hypothetical protein [Laribacter hongkongensis]MCG9063805.1 hypothetical protein [Laribacter hongkongensis]MCG9099445.1 hypothetical protein [Laribacter hongkongensis]MCG9102531.1 hypothetical protein [Laribacter hongkongensis]MCG9112000.1 hypothetical protein [Laribacter hongkongensis]